MADGSPITFAYPSREHEALREDLERAVTRVLRSGSYVLGPDVQAFEKAFCEYTGAPHTIAVSSGTDALVCALLALGIGPGDDVIVPAFGFVAAAEAIVRVGATPVFVDVEPRTLGPDPEACKEVIGASTRAVIVMHLFGQAVDLEVLRKAIGELPIVEDAAQAIGTRVRRPDYRDEPVGAGYQTRPSDRTASQVGTIERVGTFSFFPAKSLGAAGDAGAVTTADPELALRVRRARAHGASRAYVWDGPGGNYRMDAIQAALLTVKLGALDARLLRRQQIGRRLAEVASAHDLRVLSGGPSCEPTYAPFVLRLSNRDEVLERLRARGVDARVHYPTTLCDAPMYRPLAGPGPWPEARRATRELLSLPCSPELSDDEVERLVGALSEVLHG